MKLNGIFASLPTPFDHQGVLYQSKIHYNVSRLNRTALAGYLVAGWAGEGALLDSEEKCRLWEEVAKAAAADKLLLAATGQESVRQTLCLTARAAALGYQAAVVEAPRHYEDFTALAETQKLFFRAVADQSALPVIVDSPALSGARQLDADLVGALAEHPNIAALLDGLASMERIERLIQALPQEFGVLTGSAQILFPSLKAGVHAAVLAFASAAPYHCLCIEEAVRTREYEGAEELQARATPAADAVTTRYGVPGLKYAMDWQGYYGGSPRLPLLPVGPPAKRHIEESFREIRS